MTTKPSPSQTEKKSGGIIRVKKMTRSFSIVPDSLIMDKKLRIDTRLLLGYLGGRPGGWEPHVGQLCRAIGLTDWAWRQIKDELKQNKIMIEFECQSRGATGFQWVMEIDLSRYF